MCACLGDVMRHDPQNLEIDQPQKRDFVAKVFSFWILPMEMPEEELVSVRLIQEPAMWKQANCDNDNESKAFGGWEDSVQN